MHSQIISCSVRLLSPYNPILKLIELAFSFSKATFSVDSEVSCNAEQLKKKCTCIIEGFSFHECFFLFSADEILKSFDQSNNIFKYL